MVGLSVAWLAACAARYNSVEEFRAEISGHVSPGQPSAAVATALESIGFRCHPSLRTASTTVCVREAQGLPCKQVQGVSFAASSPAIGAPDITLDQVCL